MTWQVERALGTDYEELVRLLVLNRLPAEGLRDHISTTFVAREAGEIVGSAALEIYADGALLRSVAVRPGRQRQGLGQELTSGAIRVAEELHVPAVYLLTTTAEKFFPKFGFEQIARAEVPSGVRQSVEFTSACPASATVMRKVLSGPAGRPTQSS